MITISLLAMWGSFLRGRCKASTVTTAHA